MCAIGPVLAATLLRPSPLACPPLRKRGGVDQPTEASRTPELNVHGHEQGCHLGESSPTLSSPYTELRGKPVGAPAGLARLCMAG